MGLKEELAVVVVDEQVNTAKITTTITTITTLYSPSTWNCVQCGLATLLNAQRHIS